VTRGAAGWPAVLADAAAALRRAAGRTALGRVGRGLRLVWAVGGAVCGCDTAAELWWLRLAGMVADAADELDQVPGALGVGLGTDPVLDVAVADTPALRAAVAELLAAAGDAVADHARRAAARPGAGAVALAAVLAGRATARAAAWAAGSTAGSGLP
jgi:hypothetical protein